MSLKVSESGAKKVFELKRKPIAFGTTERINIKIKVQGVKCLRF